MLAEIASLFDASTGGSSGSASRRSRSSRSTLSCRSGASDSRSTSKRQRDATAQKLKRAAKQVLKDTDACTMFPFHGPDSVLPGAGRELPDGRVLAARAEPDGHLQQASGVSRDEGSESFHVVPEDSALDLMTDSFASAPASSLPVTSSAALPGAGLKAACDAQPRPASVEVDNAQRRGCLAQFFLAGCCTQQDPSEDGDFVGRGITPPAGAVRGAESYATNPHEEELLA